VNLYLFFGYAVLWTLIFIYLVFLHRRQRQMCEDLGRLTRTLKEE
jgi:CcmD family protein